MAKVFSYNGSSTYPAILEDPRPGNDGFYIYGDRHDKTSLTPQFNSRLNLTTGSSFGGNSQIASANTSSSYTRAQHMFLNKPMVHLPPWQNTSQNYYNIPDDTSWRWMDETMHTNVGLNEFSNTDGSNKTFGVPLPNNNSTDSRYNYGHLWNSTIPDSTYLHEVRPSATMGSVSVYGYHHMFIKDSGTNGYILGMYQYSASNQFHRYHLAVMGSGFPSSWSSWWGHGITNMSSYWTAQWLGKSQNDGSYFVAGNYAQGGNYADAVRITKVLMDGDNSPTQTAVHDTYDSAAPLAGAGTHQGGNNLNGKAFWHANSKIFDDPRAAGKKCFYKPYFDSYGDFHPLLTTWTLADDSFVTETDISITGDKSTVHASLLSYAEESGSTSRNTCIVAEQWYSGTARYVSYFPVDHRGAFGGDSGFKTLIAYQVDAANPKALTYHSKLELSESFRNYIWLNDDHTLLGLLFKNGFKMYVWNDISGWTETTTIGERVHCVGRDSLDRIWYTTDTSTSTAGYADVNLLSPTLPVSVNITPELSSYAYGGSDITTYIDVSTLNSSGARIAVNVRLVIEGGAMTFDDGSTVKTVTTLTTGDLQVATKVVGAGYTNVTASIQL